MSDHHVVCSTVLSTLSSSFSAYFKKHDNTKLVFWFLLNISAQQMCVCDDVHRN